MSAKSTIEIEASGERREIGPVQVSSDRYHGHAVAVKDNEPMEKVACLLDNGNVWWYPIEDVKPAKWSDVPRSNRRAYLRMKGYSVLI